MSDTVAISRRRETTRRRLLDAAAEVFAEVGMDAASVETICDAAGFTRGAFYSNFASKEELFFALVRLVADARVGGVREKVAALEAEGPLEVTSRNAVEVVRHVLDIEPDDRFGVLLSNEIRIHALRDPDLAQAYLEQESAICASVARLLDDVAGHNGMSFHLPSRDVARILVTAWDSAAVRGVMAGLGQSELARHIGDELGSITAALLVD
ncbi:helix-turn-helix domain-containing protein [Microbacterium sp. SSW1-59]|uniref:TetR/AcrR family transcriptional regulator n=1 Tax=Microbacterium xanthum TaxID=3079794 RepID=UPI002AD3C055|nr:helix-turn-helix domain-containing protein [Microbacterium sp. SSW1-59]MDZ8200155.1 helix-turn-helix domain-containing protein [Microbacterium sp. SSW1-59]